MDFFAEPVAEQDQELNNAEAVNEEKYVLLWFV